MLMCGALFFFKRTLTLSFFSVQKQARCVFVAVYDHFSILSQPKPQYAVTIAVSSRTLFNMVAERKIYEEEGMEKYVAYQVEHEDEPLEPGAAFPFVKVGQPPQSAAC